jgi:acyl-CoA reductase-like NAD-dependent aldehyde dehydrogenase
MKHRNSVLLALCLGASTWCAPVQAQPDPNAGKAQNPVAGDKANLDKAMAAGRDAAEKMLTLSPAQRREWMLQTTDEAIRALLEQHAQAIERERTRAREATEDLSLDLKLEE